MIVTLSHYIMNPLTAINLSTYELTSKLDAVRRATTVALNAHLILPLRDLLAFAANVGRGNLAVRTEHTGGDELGRLA